MPKDFYPLLLLVPTGLILARFSRFFIKKVFTNLSKKFSQDIAKEIQDFSLSPFQILIFSFFLYNGISLSKISPAWTSLLSQALYLLLGYSFVLIGYGLLDLAGVYASRILVSSKSFLHAHVVSYVKRFLKVLLFILVVLLLLQNAGFNVTSLVASLGIGGLALALGAKETLSNLFGGITVIFDEPFSIGDWIACEKIEGTVENIGFRSTQIKTFYDSLVTVPNSVIANSVIDNLGKRKSRRSRFTLDITYDTPPEKIETFLDGIRKILHSNKFVRKDYYQVYFSSYASSSLQIFVNFFLTVEDWDSELQEKQNIFLEILKLSNTLGVSFAFPTQTLDIPRLPTRGEQ